MKSPAEKSDAELMMWEAVLADPTLPIDAETLRLVVADQQRWSRRWIYPWLRIVSRVAVGMIQVAKRVVPVPVSAHGLMDRLCLWFLRHFVDPGAVTLLIRHFVIETNLLNFVLRNTRPTGFGAVALRPTALAGLGDRAVIQHDINVYEVMIALRDRRLDARGPLDFGVLDVPPIDPEAGRRRLMRLDIQTALCLMNIPFALCLTGPGISPGGAFDAARRVAAGRAGRAHRRSDVPAVATGGLGGTDGQHVRCAPGGL